MTNRDNKTTKPRKTDTLRERASFVLPLRYENMRKRVLRDNQLLQQRQGGTSRRWIPFFLPIQVAVKVTLLPHSCHSFFVFYFFTSDTFNVIFLSFHDLFHHFVSISWLFHGNSLLFRTFSISVPWCAKVAIARRHPSIRSSNSFFVASSSEGAFV